MRKQMLRGDMGLWLDRALKFDQVSSGDSPAGVMLVMAKQENTERCRLHSFYEGRVQGVGFRYTVKSVATGFEVTGIVRNLADGRVELICEGARGELEAFQEAIREAGLNRLIAREEAAWSEARGEFRGFAIVT
jgi:acylphosphatase